MAGFGIQFLERMVDSKDIYKVLRIVDFSDEDYWITAINEVVYDPKVKLHNEIRFSSPQGTTMVNCELSYLNSNGKVHLYDYLFGVPSSGDASNFNAYTVKYDSVLKIHRVFENRHQGVDPKDELWNECVRSRWSQQALASSTIAFPFLSWPFAAPVPKTTKSLTTEGTSSSSSERSGTNTPITPVTPCPERSFPKVDVHNAKLSITTNSLDLAASFNKSKGSPTRFNYPNLEKHQPHRALYKRNGEHPMETVEVASTEKHNQNIDGSLKSPEVKTKGVATNVTVQAQNRYLDVHAWRAVVKGLPGPSPLRTCWSINDTAGVPQQILSSGQLTRKTLPQKEANPVDRTIRESNAECKAYQGRPYTPGHLSQYLRAGSEAEINKVWYASRLSEAPLAFIKAKNLAVALWRWHQMYLKTKELRIFGGFVPARLSRKERDIDERSTCSHPTNQIDSGLRTEDSRETNPKGKGPGSPPHHWNWLGQPIHCKTYTPPEVSLWASYHAHKPSFRAESREAVTVSQAWKLVDPYFYRGPPEHLYYERGAKLREVVIGLVDKVYRPIGTWIYDRYDFDETVPMSSDEVARCYGWVDHNHQMPQKSRALAPQDDPTVTKDNGDFYRPKSNVDETWRLLAALDLAPGNRPMPELNVESRLWLEALDLAWDKPWPEFEDLTSSTTTATPQALDTAEQSASNSSEEDEATSEVLDEQSGPERQTTASAVAGEDQDRSYSDFLDASLTEEDLIESTPPSQGRPSVSPDADNSPTPQRTLPFDNGPANALTATLASGGSGEETQARLARALQRSPPTDRPHIHNIEDEDSIDYTNTWPKRNQLPTTPNPKLAKFAETSMSGEGGYEDLIGTGPSIPARRPRTLTGGERQRQLYLDARETEELQESWNDCGGVEDHFSFYNARDSSTRPEPSQSLFGRLGGLADSDVYDADASRVQIPNDGSTGTEESSDVSTPTDEERSEMEGLSKTLDEAPRSLSNAALERTLERVKRMRVQAEQCVTPTKKPAAKQNCQQEQGHEAAGTSAMKVKESVEQAVEARTEGPPAESTKLDGEADLVDASEWSEPQVVDGWLEYMAERASIDDATENEQPASAGQEVARAVDDSPIEGEAPQTDPSWLDYQEARGVSDAVFDNQVLREEAEWAAEEAAQKREAQNEEDMLKWLQEAAAFEANEQDDVQRERQRRAATTAALAQFSDVSGIPLPSTPTFSEYLFGSWALSLGAVVEKLPFVVPFS